MAIHQHNPSTKLLNKNNQKSNQIIIAIYFTWKELKGWKDDWVFRVMGDSKFLVWDSACLETLTLLEAPPWTEVPNFVYYFTFVLVTINIKLIKFGLIHLYIRSLVTLNLKQIYNMILSETSINKGTINKITLARTLASYNFKNQIKQISNMFPAYNNEMQKDL